MMKKITVFVMALCAFAFVSCGGGNTPSSAVKSYLNCVKSGKYEKALEHFNLDKAEAAELKALADKMGKAIEEKGGMKSFELVKGGETISEDGNTASVATKITYGNGKVDEDTFKLKKVDGEWKMDLMSK